MLVGSEEENVQVSAKELRDGRRVMIFCPSKYQVSAKELRAPSPEYTPDGVATQVSAKELRAIDTVYSRSIMPAKYPPRN